MKEFYSENKKNQCCQLILIKIMIVFSVFLGTNALAQENSEIRNGQTIFNEYCASCHDGGFKAWITSSPKIGVADEWTEFFKKGVDKMTHNVYSGEKKHEVKGECNDCSKAEIKATIEYIISVTK